MNSGIDDFIRYASQWNPAFMSGIRGATPEEVSRLEQLAGINLPAEYGEFLMRMGHESGKLGLDMDATADITDVIEFYEGCIGDTDFSFPASCVLLVTGRIANDIYVEFSGEPRVVYVESGEVVGVHADSFTKFLYRCAFDSLRMPTLPHSASLTSSFAQVGHKNVLNEGRRIAQDLGFTEEWFSDSIEVCGTSADSCIAITQFAKQGLTVSVSSRKLREIMRVGWKFKKELGLEVDRWKV